MNRYRSLILLTVLGLVLGLATNAGADLRTRTIRLVADQEWNPSPTAIQVSMEVNADMSNGGEFATLMEDYVRQAFEKLDYTLSADAPVQVHFTIDQFDKGKWVKRYLKGDGMVLGTIEVTEDGKVVGSYRYSSRLRGGIAGTSVKMMAKEVGPPLVLKLTNGERDDQLHGED
jgi:hypothetical protein